MKIFYKSLMGETWCEAHPYGTNVLPPLGAALRVMPGEKAIQGIKVEDQWYEASGGNEIEVNVSLEEKDNLTVRVHLTGGDVVRYQFLKISEVGLEDTFFRSLADFLMSLEGLSTDGILTWDVLNQAIQYGDLKLLTPNKALTPLDKDWLLEEIEEVLPHLANICSRPYLHLKIDEAIRPVDAVRRTGPAALRHLASHSEHWEARTFSGLRPARLLAQVVEDDLELYENRFIKTLIDRLFNHIGRKLRFLYEDLEQNRHAIKWEEYAKEFGDYRRNQMLTLLIPNVDMDKIRKENLKYEALKERLVKIQAVLSSCKNTWLYKSLSNCMPVFSPIQPTNILMMDTNYHPLYLLWLELDSHDHQIEKAVGELLPSELRASYSAYCQVLLLMALHVAGFVPTEGEQQKVGTFDESGHFHCSGSYRRGDWTANLEIIIEDEIARLDLHLHRQIKSVFPIPEGVTYPRSIPEYLTDLISCQAGSIVFTRKLTLSELQDIARLVYLENNNLVSKKDKNLSQLKRQAQSWSTFIHDISSMIQQPDEIIVSLWPVLLSLGQEGVLLQENTSYLLSDATEHTRRKNIASSIFLAPVLLSSLPGETSIQIIRRISNQGDLFIGEDAALWGDRQAGLLPVSSGQINSLPRLVRLINTHTLGRDIVSGRELDECPICKSRGCIVTDKSGGTGYLCQSCGAIWGVTQCKYDDCRHEFAWMRPREKEGPQGEYPYSYANWIEHLENIAGVSAITGYCEAPQAKKAYVPICPKCGRCPHHKDHWGSCPRCDSTV